MHRRNWLMVVTGLLVSAARVFAETPTSPERALEHVAHVIEHSFPDVAHLTQQALADLLEATDKTVVLLDVRSSDEFAISRIPGAIRIDPSAKSTSGIVSAVGSLEGKTIVAYCSIGLRSSRLLVRIGQAMTDRGAVQLYNLRGGVFQWRNEQRPLSAGPAPTRRIHPYSVGWRQYLSDEP